MGSLLDRANEIMEDYSSVDEYIKKIAKKESKEDIQRQITQHYNAIKRLKKRL